MTDPNLVYIKHSKKLSAYEASRLHAALTGFVRRHGGKLGVERLSVDVDVLMKDGGPSSDKRRKYSMHAVMRTAEGVYRASSSSWSASEASRLVESGLTKQAMRHKGRKKSIMHSIRRLMSP